MRLSIIDKAFYRLKGYCEKQVNCDRCRFKDALGGCVFRHDDIPANWEMPGEKKDGANDG